MKLKHNAYQITSTDVTLLDLYGRTPEGTVYRGRVVCGPLTSSVIVRLEKIWAFEEPLFARIYAKEGFTALHADTTVEHTPEGHLMLTAHIDKVTHVIRAHDHSLTDLTYENNANGES